MGEMAVGEFVAKLRPVLSVQDDGYHLDPPAIAHLVAEAPAAAARLIAQALRMEATDERLFRIAEIVAVAYRVVHDDDMFEREVGARGEELGRKPGQIWADVDGTRVPLTLLEVFENAVKPLPEQTAIPIAISREELTTLDVYQYIRAFSPSGRSAADLNDLRGRRGRYALTFMVADDHREVVCIPEVRRFVAKLHEALPFFPYYLDLSPESAMLPMYVGCLVDPSAVEPNPEGGWTVDATHPSVSTVVLETAIGVAELANELGDDPEPLCRQVLSLLPLDPEPVCRQVLSLLPLGKPRRGA